MIHYVDNLEVEPIKINGIDTATFTEHQTAFCGLRLKVKSRKEFATQLNGIGMVNCPDCLDKWRKRINRPFDCERCKKILELNDINELLPMDLERLCLECRQK
jgi:hypothetical protein